MAEWEERRLCDDGGCTGVIGRDGRCQVCGRASQFWGDERRRGMRPDAEVDEAVARRAARAQPAAEGDIADRRLCPDGSCTGLVGADGKCKVCGAVDESAPVRGELGAAGVGVVAAMSGGREDEDGEDDADGDDDDGDADSDADDDADADADADEVGDDSDGEGDDDEDGDDDDGEDDDDDGDDADEGEGGEDDDDGEGEADDAGGGRIAAKRGGDRELCPDGSCTGLIGADGRCKVCGARAEA